MANYSVAEAKNRLPALLNAMERGETVTITRRGRPVANLTPTQHMAEQPVYGSIAWLMDEVKKLDLPAAVTDGPTIVRAMRDEAEPW